MDFDDAVLHLVKQIPMGRVTTYGALAKALGKPKAARAVGGALNKNPDPVRVPCHRVVRSDGSVGGYVLGAERKIELLDSEHILVKNRKIRSLKDFLFKDFKPLD